MVWGGISWLGHAKPHLPETKHHSARPNGAFAQVVEPSDRGLRVRSEVMVESHLAADDVVVFPAHGALGKIELRLDDLLEQWIARHVLLDDLVIELELSLEDCVRRLEEADLILRLQRYVILRVAVDRLPLHVLGSGLNGVLDNRLHLRR